MQFRATASKMTDNYAIVQFDGPIRPQWRYALEQLGAVIMDYLPDFAYIVRLPQSAQAMAARLNHVRWIGTYDATWRLSRETAALSNFVTSDNAFSLSQGFVILHIEAFPGENRRRIIRAIKSLGGRVRSVSTSDWGTRFLVVLKRERITEVAEIPGIKWVDIRKPHRASNEIATRITQTKTIRSRAGGFYGEGQIVAICDSGLDKGSPTDIHPDFLDGDGNSRVLNIFSWGDDSFASDRSGHGTHVAGSLLGNGFISGATPATNHFPGYCHAGIAPKAQLVFQAVSDKSGSSLSGIPADLKRIFQQALDAGASIHSNSWGTGGAGSYDNEAVDVDQFCWDNKDFLILFAAGNAGRDKDLDGVVDLYSIDSPATAKNCLTVGASESFRTAGGLSDTAYGEVRNYYGQPIASDLFSNNIRGLAAFSSHGPCLDGRRKPDLVAPGTNILSTRSAYQEGNGWGEYDDWYYYSGGSSMATPITAGAATILREYLTKKVGQFRHRPPSSAMLKACLVNAALDIAPGQYGNSYFKEIRQTPGPAAGWGRLNLARAIAPPFPFFNTYVDNALGLKTGEKIRYTVSAVSSDQPLHITLAWTDYPASAAAGGGLVNDLDLMVRDQSSQVFYPDNAQSQTEMAQVVYLSSVDKTLNAPKIAMRLTPDAYPKRLGSLFFVSRNQDSIPGDVKVDLYQADQQGQPAGKALFSTTIHTWPSGEFALPIDVEVTSGELVAVFTFEKPEHMGIYAKDGADWEGRTLVDRGNGWEAADALAAVGGLLF